MNVQHVHELIQRYEKNILSPTAIELSRYNCVTLRSCMLCIMRYILDPNNLKLKSVIEKCLVSDLQGKELLYALIWHLTVTSHLKTQYRKHHIRLLENLPTELQQTFKQQIGLLSVLSVIHRKVRHQKSPSRHLVLRQLIEQHGLLLAEPVRLPIEGLPKIDGIIPQESFVFTSSLCPLLLTFRTIEGTNYRCIFKEGDDLRQDHMVIQIIRYMNAILLQHGLDLRIVTYDVTSTAEKQGLIQYVNSKPLSKLVGSTRFSPEKNGLQSYLDSKLKMENYIFSTAGYCLFTYLLCIGDRHLDNMLVTPDGYLFHIDYGFVGREPKPFSPLIKLCPDMIHVMGGQHSGYYQQFINKLHNAYKILRKYREPILDYIHSFCIHGVTDINTNYVHEVSKRFHSHLTETEGSNVIMQLIEKGFTDVLPRILDKIHHIYNHAI